MMNYSFDSIAGYETEKEELKRLCEIFNNREKYEKKGAKLPKGIIFFGEAGTGKTLFSKVMASVCGLEVYKIDLGDVENESSICRHIKKTFIKASKSKEPTMIFFDEMDKVLPNAHEEYYTDRSKTILTQLLTLIDGMDSASNIVFVATCNNYDALPDTLTRPGRLDKKIGIGIPTYPSRVAILKMYAKKSSCRFALTMEEIAKMSNGFSCAALQTLINECILHSDENGFVSEELIRERFLELKREDIPRERSAVEDAICACRNVGAFLVAKTYNNGHYVLNLEDDDTCNDHFNSILTNLEEYDDYDDYDDDDDDESEEKERKEGGTRYSSRSDLLACITVLLGGYVAQEIVFHKVYNNLSSYLSAVDNLLLSMARNGMFGLSLTYSEDRFNSLSYSNERIERINRLFDETTEQCYARAQEILKKNEDILKKLIPHLVEKQMLQEEECEALIAEWGGLRS